MSDFYFLGCTLNWLLICDLFSPNNLFKRRYKTFFFVIKRFNMCQWSYSVYLHAHQRLIYYIESYIRFFISDNNFFRLFCNVRLTLLLGQYIKSWLDIIGFFYCLRAENYKWKHMFLSNVVIEVVYTCGNAF